MGVVYNPAIVRDGLVLCLDAGNPKSYPGSGTTWTDLSGNGRNGTLTNGPTYSSSNGGNIVFDGSNDVVRVSNNFIPADSPISISLWTKITTGSALVDTINDSVAWDGFGLWGNGSGNKFRWILLKQYSNPTISVFLNSNTSWTSGVWTNATVTYNQSVASIYVNGAFDVSTGYSGGYDIGQSFIGIGARQSGGSASNCSISQVSIYNRALTAQEIQQNFNATKSRYL
jgi:hypothetical protein